MKNKNNLKLIRNILAIAYIITAQFWLLAAILNTDISPIHNYISDLFLSSQPHAWLFRTFEVLNGVILLVLAFPPLSNTVPRFKRKQLALWITRAIAVLTIVDAVFIDACISVKASCNLEGLTLFSSLIHGLESIVSVIAILALTLLLEHSFRRYHVAFKWLFVASIVLIGLQLAGPYALFDKGLWQRAFSIIGVVPITLLFIV